MERPSTYPTFLYRSPINSLLVIDERMLATGDDQGVIKVIKCSIFTWVHNLYLAFSFINRFGIAVKMNLS